MKEKRKLKRGILEERTEIKRRKIACCTKWKPALTGLVLTQRITSIIKSSGVGRDISEQQAAYFHRPDMNVGFFLIQARCKEELNKCIICRLFPC